MYFHGKPLKACGLSSLVFNRSSRLISWAVMEYHNYINVSMCVVQWTDVNTAEKMPTEIWCQDTQVCSDSIISAMTAAHEADCHHS